MMEANPLDSGRWVMKSIEMLSQHLVGMVWSLLVDFTVLESFSDKNCELKRRDEQGKFKIEKGPFMAIF